MNLLALALLIASIDTGGHPNPDHALGDGGRAVGRLQMHEIMVDECNRILGYGAFTHKDRTDTQKSLAMCIVFLRRQRQRKPGATRLELICSWNSGSINKPCSPSYRLKVKEILK